MTCPKCRRLMASTELLYCSECELELKSLEQNANEIRRLEIAIENVQKDNNNKPKVLKILQLMLNSKKLNTEKNCFNSELNI